LWLLAVVALAQGRTLVALVVVVDTVALLQLLAVADRLKLH
jgi:hypothetical protein